MCTRDFQRDTMALEPTSNTPEAVPGLGYLIVLEPDGSFGRRFVAARRSEAASVTGSARTHAASDGDARQRATLTRLRLGALTA